MNESYYKKALIFAGLIFTLIAFTGCNNKTELHNSEISAQGLALENYLPPDTFIAFGINFNDPDQNEKLSMLGEYFPEESTKIIDGLLEEIQRELDKDEVSFEDDILPALGENPRFLIGMAGEITLDEDDKPTDPDMYVAATLNNPEKMREFFDKIAENNSDTIKGELFDAMILDNNESATYTAIYKDTFLLTNKKQLRHEALKRMKNNEESLLSSPLYKEVYEKTQKPNLGTFYMDYVSYFNAITALEGEDYPLTLKKGFDMAMMMATSAEDEGLKILAKAAYKGDINLNDLELHEPYLYKGISGENLIMYAEAYNLKQIIDLSFSMYDIKEEAGKELRKVELLIKKTVGLDLKEDVLSWMDKGFAFALQRNDSIVPAISFYIDASSNPEGAAKFVDIINTSFDQAYENVLETANDDAIDIETIMNKEIVKVGNSDMHKFSFDLSQMTDEELLAAGMPSGLFNEPFEVYYGLTANNYFVFSTLTGLDSREDNFLTVSQVVNVQEGRELVNDYPFNFSYLSVDEGIEYIDFFIGLMEKIQGPMPDDFAEGYATFKDFAAPVKYMISADKLEESVMFVKIGE